MLSYAEWLAELDSVVNMIIDEFHNVQKTSHSNSGPVIQKNDDGRHGTLRYFFYVNSLKDIDLARLAKENDGEALDFVLVTATDLRNGCKAGHGLLMVSNDVLFKAKPGISLCGYPVDGNWGFKYYRVNEFGFELNETERIGFKRLHYYRALPVGMWSVNVVNIRRTIGLIKQALKNTGYVKRAKKEYPIIDTAKVADKVYKITVHSL